VAAAERGAVRETALLEHGVIDVREANELSPAVAAGVAGLEKKLGESRAWFEETLRDGWIRNPDDPNELFDPSDRDICLRRDPFTGETFLSPKLVERIERQCRVERSHEGDEE
jgi:hypothetical protein